jgi:hypothetical protein
MTEAVNNEYPRVRAMATVDPAVAALPKELEPLAANAQSHPGFKYIP